MAVITLCRGRDLIAILAVGNDSIVATTAYIQHLEMVDLCGRFPDVSGMTMLTNLGGVDVIDTLAGGRSTIMATGTICGDTGVIKAGR